jgi:ubiquinone/menaquinone biosynthesis C-methylase UbiE
MTDTDTQRHYLPATGKDWALPLYDPFVKLFGGDSARKVLIDQAALSSGLRILDIGCGTGTMAVLIERLHPDVTVVGLDPDPKALARARHKGGRDRLSIQFDRGFSDQLLYPDASFDRVFSSLMYHHLPADEKHKTLREVRRVLRPGASFHLMDLLGSEDHGHGFLSRILHAGEHLHDNSASEILARLQQAGFPAPQKLAQRRLIFGPIAVLPGSHPRFLVLS